MLTGEASSRLIAEALALAVEAVDAGHRRPATIIGEHLGRCLEAYLGCHGTVDHRERRFELDMWGEGIDVATMLAAAERIPQEHPIMRHYMHGYTDTTAISVLTAGQRLQWRRSEGYAVLERALGVVETAAVRLDDGRTAQHVVCVARDRDFSESELRLLDLAKRPMVALERHAATLRQLDAGQASTSREAALAAGLTLREVEVLRLLATGLVATSIAHRLAISPRTVHRHLANVYEKLRTHDRLSTVMRAQGLGILSRADVVP